MLIMFLNLNERNARTVPLFRTYKYTSYYETREVRIFCQIGPVDSLRKKTFFVNPVSYLH